MTLVPTVLLIIIQIIAGLCITAILLVVLMALTTNAEFLDSSTRVLLQISFAALLQLSAIFSLAVQEPAGDQATLDTACTASAWLYFVGLGFMQAVAVYQLMENPPKILGRLAFGAILTVNAGLDCAHYLDGQ